MSTLGLSRTRKTLTHWHESGESVAAAYDIREKTEKTGFVKPGEERTEGTSYCCLQRTNG